MDYILSGIQMTDSLSDNDTISDILCSAPDVLTRLPVNWSQWAGAVLGSLLVGLAGVLPLVIVPSKLGSGSVSDENLKYLLGFAVGGLLGDVFLHLLPETYQHVSHPLRIYAGNNFLYLDSQMIDNNEEGGHTRIGSAILCGILSFLVLEKILELSNPETNPELREASDRKIVGYLNLFANW